MQLFLKRILDIFVSFFGLMLLSPLFLIVYVLVKLDSDGPGIIRQERVGKDAKRFIMYKFRSMVKDAEKGLPIWPHNPDDRITRIGRIIRRCNIDELPQLFNVLKGQMSLVGPRPERQFFVEQFERQMPTYLQRLRVKPGITGWAQANGLYGNTSIALRLEYDLNYINNQSMKFDLKILLLTVKQAKENLINLFK